MKFFLLFLILLSSCSLIPEPDMDLRMRSLEEQVRKLQSENANLKIENDLLRQGGIPEEGGGTATPSSLFPEGTTFEESDNTACLDAAYLAFIEAGNAACTSSGYSEEDITNGKCKLTPEMIQTLNEGRKNAEIQCGPQ